MAHLVKAMGGDVSQLGSLLAQVQASMGSSFSATLVEHADTLARQARQDFAFEHDRASVLRNVLWYVLTFFTPEENARVAVVSKDFAKACSSPMVWRIIDFFKVPSCNWELFARRVCQVKARPIKLCLEIGLRADGYREDQILGKMLREFDCRRLEHVEVRYAINWRIMQPAIGGSHVTVADACKERKERMGTLFPLAPNAAGAPDNILKHLTTHCRRLRTLDLGWLGNPRGLGGTKDDASSAPYYKLLPESLESLTCRPFRCVPALNHAVEHRLRNLKELRIRDGAGNLCRSHGYAPDYQLRFTSTSLEKLYLHQASKQFTVSKCIATPNLELLTIRAHPGGYGAGPERDSRYSPLDQWGNASGEWEETTCNELVTAGSDIDADDDSFVPFSHPIPGFPSECRVLNIR
jgi:hypothetical protein